jgi:hypothetical protein
LTLVYQSCGERRLPLSVKTRKNAPAPLSDKPQTFILPDSSLRLGACTSTYLRRSSASSAAAPIDSAEHLHRRHTDKYGGAMGRSPLSRASNYLCHWHVLSRSLLSLITKQCRQIHDGPQRAHQSSTTTYVAFCGVGQLALYSAMQLRLNAQHRVVCNDTCAVKDQRA